MTCDKPFYVYEHWRPDTNQCFYVGKGKGKRAWTIKGRQNRHHASIVSKLTAIGLCVDVRIVASDLSEEQAFNKERELIAFYGRDSLTNMSDGGEGLANPSKETRAKMSKAAKGHKRRLGVRLSDEARAKIGSASVGNKNMLGKRHTPKAKKRLSDLGHANKEQFMRYQPLGPAALSKAVICLDDGVEFPSASAAARHYGISRSALIELCLGKNYRKSVGGRVFKYKEAA
jgi:hypothetical protein